MNYFLNTFKVWTIVEMNDVTINDTFVSAYFIKFLNLFTSHANFSQNDLNIYTLLFKFVLTLVMLIFVFKRIFKWQNTIKLIIFTNNEIGLYYIATILLLILLYTLKFHQTLLEVYVQFHTIVVYIYYMLL